MMKSLVRESRTGTSPILLVIPSFVLLTLIIVIPCFYALYLSFTETIPGYGSTFIGLENYKEIFTDSGFYRVLLNNLVFLVGSLIFEVLLGFGGALLLLKVKHFRMLWVTLLLSPYAVSSVVSVTVWKFLLDPANGIINYLLSIFGIAPIPWFTSTATYFIPIILVGVWKSFPFMLISMYAALVTIPEEVREAAQIDGVSGVRYFLKITLPLVAPAFMIALLFRMITLIRTFEQVWIFTAGGPGRTTEILAISLYKEAFMFFDYGKASAIAWVLLIITVVISIPIVRENIRRR